MLNQFSRTELIIGKEGIDKLQNAKVAVFGIGGVGSYVVEGLVRAGVGNFILVDDDKICLTNLNRQIIATRKTIGKPKVEVAKERILEINPNANVEIYQEFFMPDSQEILDETVDYVVDSVDTVTAKIELVMRAKKHNIPIISSMGTGNKLKVVYSKEEPIIPDNQSSASCKTNCICPPGTKRKCTIRNQVPGSISFVPSVVGLIIAGEVIKDILKNK